MAAMMFQNGGYFGPYKRHRADPQILFHKMISLRILNYSDIM
jgi:hypothetical protein